MDENEMIAAVDDAVNKIENVVDVEGLAEDMGITTAQVVGRLAQEMVDRFEQLTNYTVTVSAARR